MAIFKRLIPYLSVILLGLYPLFGHLDSFPIQLWDESRLATNALEMYKTNNLLVPTFEGKPDHWNTKPPLMIWFQYCSMKMFGVSEIAVRLPAAMSGLFTILWITFFFKRISISHFGGILLCVILLTSPGYNGMHGVRFGEYDALLSLFLTIQVTAFYLFLRMKDDQRAPSAYYIFIASIILAVLTKGIAGMILIPVYVLWGLISRLWTWQKPWIYVYGLLVGGLCICSYYLSRELKDPGYLNSVFNNEISQRYLGTQENQYESWTYYFMKFPELSGNWLYVVIPVILLGLILSSKEYRTLSLYLISCLAFYFIVIQLSTTKNFWYPLPMFPILYALFVIHFEIVLRKVFELLRIQWRVRYLVVFIAGFTIIPYYRIVKDTYSTTENVDGDYGFYNTTNFLRDQLDSSRGESWKFIDNEYCAHNLWYINRLNSSGYDIRYFKHLDSIQSGDKILIRQEHLKDSICAEYECNFEHSEYSCWLLNIQDKD